MPTLPTRNTITYDPQVLGGRACIRRMRITVATVRNLLANGMTEAEILLAYPYLEAEDLRQCLRDATLHQQGKEPQR